MILLLVCVWQNIFSFFHSSKYKAEIIHTELQNKELLLLNCIILKLNDKYSL